MFIRFDMIHERDRQTDGRTPDADIGRAYASHSAAKMIGNSFIQSDYRAFRLDRFGCLQDTGVSTMTAPTFSASLGASFPRCLPSIHHWNRS